MLALQLKLVNGDLPSVNMEITAILVLAQQQHHHHMLPGGM